ncbi:MAG TPA: hypothetical protein VIV82_13510, partial [Verrucomicrobiae bacterium]
LYSRGDVVARAFQVEKQSEKCGTRFQAKYGTFGKPQRGEGARSGFCKTGPASRCPFERFEWATCDEFAGSGNCFRTKAIGPQIGSCGQWILRHRI